MGFARNQQVVDLLGWHGHSAGGVRIPFSKTMGRPLRDVVVKTAIVDRLNAAFRIESAVAATKSDYLAHAVAVMQLEKERANYIVETGTKSAAGHDGGARFLRIEEKFRPRTGHLEFQPRMRADFNAFGNMNVIADSVSQIRRKAWLTEGWRVHRKRTIARICAEKMRIKVVSG